MDFLTGSVLAFMWSRFKVGGVSAVLRKLGCGMAFEYLGRTGSVYEGEDGG